MALGPAFHLLVKRLSGVEHHFTGDEGGNLKITCCEFSWIRSTCSYDISHQGQQARQAFRQKKPLVLLWDGEGKSRPANIYGERWRNCLSLRSPTRYFNECHPGTLLQRWGPPKSTKKCPQICLLCAKEKEMVWSTWSKEHSIPPQCKEVWPKKRLSLTFTHPSFFMNVTQGHLGPTCLVSRGVF